MAANRGWLDQTWEEETIEESLLPEPEPSLLDIDEVSSGITEKLIIHQDPAPVKLAIHKDPIGEKLVIHQDPVVQKIAIHKDVVGEKIPIHQDHVIYDENGAVIEQARPPRGSKKKKVIEVNETQISKATSQIIF